MLRHKSTHLLRNTPKASARVSVSLKALNNYFPYARPSKHLVSKGGVISQKRNFNNTTNKKTPLYGSPSATDPAPGFDVLAEAYLNSSSLTSADASLRSYQYQDKSNSRELMNLLSLLDSALHLNMFQRSEAILESLYLIKSHRSQFVNDYNKYLFRLAETGDGTGRIYSFQELRNVLIADFEKKYKGITPNEKTYAILIHQAITTRNPDFDKYAFKRSIQQLLEQSYSTKKLMSNVDVLTLEDYTVLVHDLGLVDLRQIPTDLRELVVYSNNKESLSIGQHLSADADNISQTQNVGSSSEEVKKIGNFSANNELLSTSGQNEKIDFARDEVKTLEKEGLDELKSVGTVGMKAVRKSLLGMGISPNLKKRFEQIMSESLSGNHEAPMNFFEFYQKLETPEQKALFDEILDDINQERQSNLEKTASEAAKARWEFEFNESLKRGDMIGLKSMNSLLWKWYSEMLPIVKKEVELCQAALASANKNETTTANSKSTDQERNAYGIYMTLVRPENMCTITILELLKLHSTGGINEGMRLSRAVISVAKSIEMEYTSTKLAEREKKQFKLATKDSVQIRKLLHKARAAFDKNDSQTNQVIWPQDIRAKIGSILISILMQVAKIQVTATDPVTKEKVTSESPAFHHTYQYFSGSKLGVLKLHKELITKLGVENLVSAVQPQLLPMLIKPKKWETWNSGGYLYTKSKLVRAKECPEQIDYLRAVSEKGIINNVFKAVNVLGETAWTINKKVFEVMSQVWNTGEEFLEIPKSQDMLVLPPKPDSSSDPLIFRRYKLDNAVIAHTFQKNRSMRCDANYKLEIARGFLGEKFYFPHNLDFRGRAYPIAPHLNHLGNDLSRGLLLFWEGRPLGPNGLNWLKIHLANLFGFDKAPLDARVQYVNDRLDMVKKCAENPLEKDSWWQTADKPWQALSTIFEINEALKCADPEKFVSHQPVHQDGTCNGLQHYAALGGDLEGATQVNLVPGEKPQDVYSHVASLVNARVDKEAAEGNENALKVKGHITRKVVKQTVMTNVYGVTLIGARAQVFKQLTNVFSDRTEATTLSNYVTTHVFASIRELFHSAHLIQDWLADCAKIVSKSVAIPLAEDKAFKSFTQPLNMSSVIWTTPLGLPIVQPYRKVAKKQIFTAIQSVYISDPLSLNPVDARKQKMGFPPNFIHSLDATHMLLSAIKCGEAGLRFASVHDSYWTHACDVEKMNKILRQEFINLHEVDLIERLKNEFDTRYKDNIYMIKIIRKSPLGKELLEYRADLQAKLNRVPTFMDEIYLERVRRDYLNSDDPELVAKAKSMKTVLTICSSFTAQEIEEFTTKAKTSGVVGFLPVLIPPIPPKGEFDVTELRNSTYFFS